MSCKHAVYLLLIIVSLWATPTFAARIANGDFESADQDASLNFDPPSFWIRENYAAIHQNYIPNPIRGSTVNWKIDPQEGIFPFEGESFVLLNTGGITPEPGYAILSQRIKALPDQRLSGVYFFGTCDYLDFNDQCEIKLVADPNDNPNDEIIIAAIDLEEIGDYGSTDGWQRFEYWFTEETAGEYYLTLLVQDIKDTIFETYLAVDDLKLCTAAQAGDINYSCRVDLEDFAILASDWLMNCSDPNTFCHHGTDMNGDFDVNMTELNLLTDNWMDGQENEFFEVEVTMDDNWMYQNLPDKNKSRLTATASVILDPSANSAYTYIWEFEMPPDANSIPTIVQGGTQDDDFCVFAASDCQTPDALSESGLPFKLTVTVRGKDYIGEYGTVVQDFEITPIGDVNKDKFINAVDRALINTFKYTGQAGEYTLKDCDLNCDGVVDSDDMDIINDILQGIVPST